MEYTIYIKIETVILNCFNTLQYYYFTLFVIKKCSLGEDKRRLLKIFTKRTNCKV